MSYLLKIDSSALGADSFSQRVARSFLSGWDGPVVERDLAASGVPHISAAAISARDTPAHLRSTSQLAAAAVQDDLVEELLGASAYLFTVPMYNWSMPSVFKAWLDQVLVPGLTIGLPGGSPTAGRPATVVSARGGGYGPGTPNHGKDFLVPTVEAILGDDFMLGLNVRMITPELTFAPVIEQMRSLVPLHEDSMRTAHAQAHTRAVELSGAADLDRAHR